MSTREWFATERICSFINNTDELPRESVGNDSFAYWTYNTLCPYALKWAMLKLQGFCISDELETARVGLLTEEGVFILYRCQNKWGLWIMSYIFLIFCFQTETDGSPYCAASGNTCADHFTDNTVCLVFSFSPEVWGSYEIQKRKKQALNFISKIVFVDLSGSLTQFLRQTTCL